MIKKLQKVIDILIDFKKDLEKSKQVERKRWTFSYIDRKTWSSFWYDKFNTTFPEILEEYIKDWYHIEDIQKILVDEKDI